MSGVLEHLRLYARYVAVSVRSQLQYRTSVILLALGHLMTTGLEFFSVWALFERFGTIAGWTLPEVALLYGMANVAFSIAEAAGRGFDIFDQEVKSGEFDRVLLRPRGTAFQVGARHFQLHRVGRLLQGLFVLAYAMLTVEVAWSLPQLGLVLAAIAAGACLFVGIFVLQATLAFWTIESLEIVNTVTYGGVELTQYPLSIYTDGFQRFFTYVLPLAFLNYVPAMALLDRPSVVGPPWLAWASPLVGIVFLLACLQIWSLGVRHYQSTGS